MGDRGEANGEGDAALDALRRVLRPLARFMIARALTLPTAVDALKDALVATAERDFGLDGRKPTDSRVSVLTGVHRKDVRARRGAAAPSPIAPRTLPATVLGRWLADPAYQGPEGQPAEIARGATGDPEQPNFETLVESISTDVRPRTVLDELLRIGAVEPAAGSPDRLRLASPAFAPQDDAAALAFLGANLADHAATAVANLDARREGARELERAVFYNNLDAEDVVALERVARARAQALLEELNAMARAAQRRAGPQARTRFRFGVYFHREAGPEDAEGAPAEKDEGERR